MCRVPSEVWTARSYPDPFPFDNLILSFLVSRLIRKVSPRNRLLSWADIVAFLPLSICSRRTIFGRGYSPAPSSRCAACSSGSRPASRPCIRGTTTPSPASEAATRRRKSLVAHQFLSVLPIYAADQCHMRQSCFSNKPSISPELPTHLCSSRDSGFR